MARVVETIRGFPGGLRGPGLVAVSGGADSVALLRGLLDAGGRAVAVGHFNHRLRGAESDGDEHFVRELAGRFGVPIRVGSADVADVGGNREATARRLRYDWLAAQAGEIGAEWVATGHTLDDQAETVLHRLMRGAGLQGLRGIAPRRPCGTVVLVRPLLGVTRAEVLDYLRELGQPFREDSSNADPAFTRNRIRHELVPVLKAFNPAIVGLLGRLARQSDEAHEYIRGEVGRALAAVRLPPAGPLTVLDAARLTELPPYLAREVLRAVWQANGWPGDGMTAGHWDRLARVAAGAEPAADFPGGVRARRVGRVVQLGPSGDRPPAKARPVPPGRPL